MLKAPFPYFGGKSRVAGVIWKRFGRVGNYVEPFAGSLAVLLARPTPFRGWETVNDLDGMISNFWRATRSDPDGVAYHADWPVNENDLHARHAWLVGRKDSLRGNLEGDPEYYDSKVAGWWVWGISCWIGGGFCSGDGPWRVSDADGISILIKDRDRAVSGIHRSLPSIGNSGSGISRKLPDVGDMCKGVNKIGGLHAYFGLLSERLRRVRVCCGDWGRVMGDSALFPSRESTMSTAIFLDPPYAYATGRHRDLYSEDGPDVSVAVRAWCVAHGDDPRLRICLAGFDGEHEMPDTWDCVRGIAGRGFGYGGQNRSGYANEGRERLWFSPHCRHVRRYRAADLPFGDDDGVSGE